MLNVVSRIQISILYSQHIVMRFICIVDLEIRSNSEYANHVISDHCDDLVRWLNHWLIQLSDNFYIVFLMSSLILRTTDLSTRCRYRNMWACRYWITDCCLVQKLSKSSYSIHRRNHSTSHGRLFRFHSNVSICSVQQSSVFCQKRVIFGWTLPANWQKVVKPL